MTHRVIFAGFGGQGVLTAGVVLAEIAVDAGCKVLWCPAYGGEMRGGKAYSTVMISDEPILSPICENLDALVAMNGPALDFCSKLTPGGLLIVNADGTDETPPDGFDARRIPLSALAENAGSQRSANLAAVGCVLGARKLFPIDDAVASLRRYFEKKGHAEAASNAIQALKAGYFACQNRIEQENSL